MSLYAASEDFEQIFSKQSTELLRLSLQLTADAENAETCIILAMRDCFFRSSISRDRVQAWARPQNVYPLGRWFSRLIHLVVAMNLVLLLRHE